MVRCLMQSLQGMMTKNEIEGISLEDISVYALCEIARSWTDLLKKHGFNVYDAIENFMKGNFASKMKQSLVEHENMEFKIPTKLLCRLVEEWLEAFVRVSIPLKMPTSRPICSMIKERITVFLQTKRNLMLQEVRAKLKFKIRLTPKVIKEILDSTLTSDSSADCGNDSSILLAKDSTLVQVNQEVHDDNDDVIAELARELVAEVAVNAGDEVKTEVLPIKKDESDSDGEAFIDRFGNAMVTHDVLIPKGEKVVVKLALCGFPHLKHLSKMTVKPLEERLLQYKIELEVLRSALQYGFTIYVRLSNPNSESVNIPAKTLLATLKASDRKDLKKGTTSCSTYATHFLRHYCSLCGTEGIVDDDNGYLHFGNGFDVSILGVCKTNFVIDRSKELGSIKHYAVRDIVFYLRNSSLECEALLLKTFEAGLNFVRMRDCANVSAYFLGHTKSVPQMKIARGSDDVKDVTSSGSEETLDVDTTYPHIIQEQDFFAAEMHSLVVQLVEEGEEEGINKDKVCQRLELFLNIIHGLKLTLSDLKYQGFSASTYRHVYETFMKKKFHEYFQGHPELSDSQEMVDRICFETIPNPIKENRLKEFHKFVKVFCPPDDEFVKILKSLSSQARIKWTEEVVKAKEECFQRIFDEKKDISELDENSQVICFADANDRILTYLLVTSGSGSAQCLVRAKSKYMNDPDLDLSIWNKMSNAVDWAVQDNKDFFLKLKTPIQIVVGHSKVLENLGKSEIWADMNHEFMVNNNSRPCLALCTRDLSEKTLSTNLEMVKTLLPIVISTLVKDLKSARIQKRHDKLRALEERKKERLEKLTRELDMDDEDQWENIEASDAPPISPPTSPETEAGQLPEPPVEDPISSPPRSPELHEMGDDAIKTSNLQPIVQSFISYFLRLGNSSCNSYEKARHLVQILMDHNVNYIQLEKGLGRANDESSMLRSLRHFCRHKEIEVPLTINFDAFHQVIVSHFFVRVGKETKGLARGRRGALQTYNTKEGHQSQFEK